MSGTKTIKLTNSNKTAIIDEEDYEKIISYGDFYLNDNGYAVRRYKGITYRMHRIVNDTPKGVHTDHINRNKLDNRKVNLRTVSSAENAQNRRQREHTKYDSLPKGVTWDFSRNQYVATHTVRKRFISFEDAINFTKGVNL